jgi:hypothetical protein
MRLIQVLIIVLTELSVGTLLISSLLPPREIRLSFFSLNSLIGALAAALALVLTRYGLGSAWWDVRHLGLTVIGATVAFGCFKLERPAGGRIFLIMSGLLGLIFGLLPLSGRALALRGLDPKAPFFFDASFLAGAALLGANTVGMILGHWYLITRRLSFEYLERFAKLLLGAVGLRALVLLGTIVTLQSFDPRLHEVFVRPLMSVQGNAMFFVLRLLLGIGAPAVLAFLILRCARDNANQAATGLLYVCEISVLFGELFAALLLI